MLKRINVLLLSEASCASFEVSSTSADNSAVVKFVSSKFMSSISISLSSENTISSAFLQIQLQDKSLLREHLFQI